MARNEPLLICLQLDDVFDEFNTRPCGAASLAQVHEARLRSNGERVAVKVQHATVRPRAAVDTKTMEIFIKLAHYVFKEFSLMWLGMFDAIQCVQMCEIVAINF